jgi:hypothetical protein
MRVQRALVDFGMEHSFASAAARFAEHYGWSIAPSVLRQWTLHHAGQSSKIKTVPLPVPAETLITGLDGSMVPIVCPAQSGDRRKNKTLLWREVKVAFARRKEDVSGRYGATLDDAFGAGLMWRETALSAGLQDTTPVHALGDGAPYIVDQCDRQFGERAKFLVDLQHVADYLSDASEPCAGKDSTGWFENQKGLLKQNRITEVLAALKTHFEPEEKDADGKTPPVRQAYRYIDERKNWMDYRGALEADLPIGSGEAESAHRHIVQARLKKAGAWWREPNVQAVLQMRTLRANGHWTSYWQQIPSLN